MHRPFPLETFQLEPLSHLTSSTSVTRCTAGRWHCGFATKEQTPTYRGFDSYFGYFGGFNDYLHAWSEQACPQRDATNHSISYNHSAADNSKCTHSSVHARHLKSTTDLWLNTHPAHGINGTGFEEAQFEERVLGIIAGHGAAVAPLYVYYAMHLVHSPLCVPEGYLEKFEFIRDADDNVNHDRQYVAAMVNYLDDVVGNVATALKNAGLWNNTLMVWSSDNGGAVEGTTGMKNSYPLRGGYTTNWEGGQKRGIVYQNHTKTRNCALRMMTMHFAGGVRADAFVNGGLLPDHVRGSRLAGAASYIHLCDWYATFCGLAGVNPRDVVAEERKLPAVDSLDMWPMLSGTNLTSPRTEILFTPLKGLRPTHGNDPYNLDIPSDMRDPMMIVGKWKLLLGQVDQCWWQGPRYPNGSNTWDVYATMVNCTDNSTGKVACLFDVIDDETEHHDVADENPEVVQRMVERMEEVQRGVFDPDRGAKDDVGACEAVEKSGGFWSPWRELAAADGGGEGAGGV